VKRGPKTGKAARGRRRLVEDMGPPPEGLGPEGQALWSDAIAHLKAEGKSARVYRHGLALLCRLVDAPGELGLNRADACRRWLHELGLTPAAAGRDGAETGAPHGEETDGRAQILALVRGRAS
jgi:hypothetical protein